MGQRGASRKYRELEKDKDHSIKAVLVCHNETATGVTSDIMAVRQILDDLSHPALLFVDGVSSIGSWNSTWIIGGLTLQFVPPKKAL